MKKRFLSIIFSVLFAVAMIVGTAGCSKSDSEDAKTGGESSDVSTSASSNETSATTVDESTFDVLKLPSPSSPTSADSITVAEELGFFKEQKIKIERVGIVPFAQMIPSLTNGNLDVGSGHINRAIAAIAAGAKVKAIAANTQTTREKPHMIFSVLENSPIKTPKDILGKNMAIMAYGGCNEYTPYEYLKKNGIKDPKGKFNIVIVPVGKEEEALRHKRVHIAGTHDDPANILGRGGVRILFSDYDIWGEEGGQAPFYASDKFLKEKPDLAKRFVTVIAKVNSWINENQQKAIEISAKKLKVDPKIVRVNYLVSDAIIKENTVQLWIDILNDFKDLKRNVTASEVYTNEFNPNYKK